MNHQKIYQIKDLAEKTGFSTDTIRFYEKKDLIHPNFRGVNNYRYYNDDSLKKLIFIKRCRALEISISEIQQLIELEETPFQSCQSVNDLIDDHIAQVSEKIQELISFKQQLIKLRASCTHGVNIDSCQILKQLEAD